jgi:hypothetical protein
MGRLLGYALVLAGCSSAPASKTYALTPFTLQPGEEQINCYYVPADRQEHYVDRFVTEMNPGSHHLIVFRIDETLVSSLPPAGPTPCAQIDIPEGLDGMIPGSQTLHSEIDLPSAIAMKLEKWHGLYFQSHYINATQAPLTTDVRYTLGFTDAAKVEQRAGMVFYSNNGLQIPPGMSTQSKTCHAPQDMSLLMATGHMHMHGLTFDAAVGGNAIYHTANWDEPTFATFDAPGLSVAQGAPMEWACAYDNTTGATLTFGNSASKNEMCILAAIYYPVTSWQTLYFCQ